MIWETHHEVISHRHNFYKMWSNHTLWKSGLLQILQRLSSQSWLFFERLTCFEKALTHSRGFIRVAEMVDNKSGVTYHAFCGMQKQGSWLDRVLKTLFSCNCKKYLIFFFFSFFFFWGTIINVRFCIAHLNSLNDTRLRTGKPFTKGG